MSKTMYSGTERPRNILLLRETTEVSTATRKSMQGNCSRESSLEVRFRQALWHAGMRGFRKNVSHLAGKPDIVFPRARLCIFVHGCFWHACPKCGRFKLPKRNRAFWQAKFEQNHIRDADNEARLRESGYEVLTFFECELNSMESCLEAVAARVSTFCNLNANTPAPPHS